MFREGVFCPATEPKKNFNFLIASVGCGWLRVGPVDVWPAPTATKTFSILPPAQTAFLRLHGYNPHEHWVFWCFYGYILRLHYGYGYIWACGWSLWGFQFLSPPPGAILSVTSVTTRINIGLSCHRKRNIEASQASHP